MNNYFRITAYNKENDYCFIIDSVGICQKLWEFGSILVNKGFEVIETSKAENMLDINITKADYDDKHYIIRATANGKPEIIKQTFQGTTYEAIKVADKIYIPDITKTI